jgi:hypothetical protein
VLTLQRQEELKLERRKNFLLLTPKKSKSGKLNSACRRWDEKLEADKTWNNFNIHFAAAYSQHRQMQG